MGSLKRKPGCIHIGTSGWHYNHWVGPFYPKHTPSHEFLGIYTQQFHTVEINNTFYQLPSQDSLMDWRKGTPKQFLFACKASRFITHMKKLKDPEPSIKRFFETIQVLGNKLGPILFQLPPRWKINIERLEAFLKVLPLKYRYAFEFRDESWFDQSVYAVLTKYHAAFCVYHLAGRWSPEMVTANFVYIRLHGPGRAYQGGYDEKLLSIWAKKMRKWSKEGKDVFCYFDNDEKAYAAKDAMKLKKKVDEGHSV
jgi:uncharacterized protein YecE (DUF72 family)